MTTKERVFAEARVASEMQAVSLLPRAGHFGDFHLRTGNNQAADPLSTASVIGDPTLGYVKDDFITLRMDLRIRRLDNESFSLTAQKQSVSCQVDPPFR